MPQFVLEMMRRVLTSHQMCPIAMMGEGPYNSLSLCLLLDPGEQDSLQQMSYILNEKNTPVQLYEQSAVGACSTHECFVHHCNCLM